jgi:glucose-1-phosphate cytidylyltransferase
MKVVILAGGLGTRISEETDLRPKPMVEIGGKPILWHIMKIYSYFGFNDFIICLGYKGYVIKEYFANYFLHMADVTFDMRNNKTEVHSKNAEPWKITLIDTGHNTMTGGRIRRIHPYIDDDTFMVTYGDGVSDVNIPDLLSFHYGHGGIATMTAVQPLGRFGAIEINESNAVQTFKEKPLGDGSWINGGFFVFNKRIFDQIKDDSSVLEKQPLQSLSSQRQLFAFKHNGFWKPMDTLREKNELETLWKNNKAPWKIWYD